jgi:hypothetical protein
MASGTLPRYYELMWPSLQAVIALGGSAPAAEIKAWVIQDQALSREQLARPHAWSRVSELDYRLYWARRHLEGIGALARTADGAWEVTAYGERLTPSQMHVETRRWRESCRPAKRRRSGRGRPTPDHPTASGPPPDARYPTRHAIDATPELPPDDLVDGLSAPRTVRVIKRGEPLPPIKRPPAEAPAGVLGDRELTLDGAWFLAADPEPAAEAEAEAPAPPAEAVAASFGTNDELPGDAEGPEPAPPTLTAEALAAPTLPAGTPAGGAADDLQPDPEADLDPEAERDPEPEPGAREPTPTAEALAAPTLPAGTPAGGAADDLRPEPEPGLEPEPEPEPGAGEPSPTAEAQAAPTLPAGTPAGGAADGLQPEPEPEPGAEPRPDPPPSPPAGGESAPEPLPALAVEAAGPRLDRASAGSVVGAELFTFPAVVLLGAGLVLGYAAGPMLAAFAAVTIALGLAGSLIAAAAARRSLRRWPMAPAPPGAQHRRVAAFLLPAVLSLTLAALLVVALILAPPASNGAAAGGLAGLAEALAVAALFGTVPLRRYERAHGVQLWLDHRADGPRSYFTTQAAPASGGSAAGAVDAAAGAATG